LSSIGTGQYEPTSDARSANWLAQQKALAHELGRRRFHFSNISLAAAVAFLQQRARSAPRSAAVLANGKNALGLPQNSSSIMPGRRWFQPVQVPRGLKRALTGAR
jgi:hypothetical protein